MSRRHQDLKPRRADRATRKAKMRRDRRTANQDLHVAGDVEDLVVTEPVFDRAPHQPPRRRRRRHWKLKAWKRRNNARRARNAELDRLVLADD